MSAAAPAVEPLNSERPTTGVLIMLAALCVFAVLNGVVKDQAASFPVTQIIFFRNFFGLIPLLLVVPFLGGWGVLRISRPAHHLLQAGFMSMTLVFSYLAFAATTLAEVTAILFLQPILMAVLAHFAFGERARPRVWLAAFVGFAGVLIIVQPGSVSINPGSLLAVAAAVGAAFAMLEVKILSSDNASLGISVWYLVLSTLIFAPTLLFWWVTPDPGQLVGLIIMGLASGIGQFMMIWAFRFARVSTLGPVQYTNLIGGVIVGFVWFGEVPSTATLIGAAVVMLALALVLPWGWAKLGRRPVGTP
jgi:drug/metabolite transporter (DMT)-like permease